MMFIEPGAQVAGRGIARRCIPRIGGTSIALPRIRSSRIGRPGRGCWIAGSKTLIGIRLQPALGLHLRRPALRPALILRGGWPALVLRGGWPALVLRPLVLLPLRRLRAGGLVAGSGAARGRRGRVMGCRGAVMLPARPGRGHAQQRGHGSQRRRPHGSRIVSPDHGLPFLPPPLARSASPRFRRCRRSTPTGQAVAHCCRATAGRAPRQPVPEEAASGPSR